MKIDPRVQLPADTQPDRVQNAGKSGVHSTSAAKNTGVSPATGEDTVKLSSTHAQVQTLAAQLNNVPEVRTNRVQALQQQIHGGQYHPDSKQVADAIIKEHSGASAKA
jgi:flagellar biosynthesis anti-sigma factor FlgM